MVNPIAFSIGSLSIRWYGTLLVIGALLSIYVFLKLRKEKGINEKDAWDYIFWMIIGLLIGARLFHVFAYNWDYFSRNLIEIFYIWHGGISSHGGIIGGIIVTLIFSRVKKIKFYDLADIGVIAVALLGVFIRIGNFVNQELVGRVTDSFLGVKFDNYEELRHPSQIYSSFKNLLLFIILFNLRKVKNLPSGFLFWSFIFLYGLFRFLVEFYKDFPINYGLTVGQYWSIPLVVLGLVMMIYLWKKRP